MFTKVNARQERFLWLVVDGQPATRAYAEAYGQHLSEATCAVNGSKLLRQTKIIARRNELVAGRAARQAVTSAFLTQETMATAAEARALGQASAAIAGYQLVAKLHGLIVDRQQTDVIVRKPSASPDSPDDMSADQWLQDFGVTVIEHNSTAPIPEPLVKRVEPEPLEQGSSPVVDP